ncbi:hypothetical protein [Ruegeria lacuscaerulensis]|uniref:hypothetical protein n=1 Tax=Ruegeria lacuscaerulensis TaxID=55218 RepID=UPI00147A7B31|nr:hypothetical protein [Ruegeria lacuscaerulensis]
MSDQFQPNKLEDSGAKWAQAFTEQVLNRGIPVDEDLMLGWFCNAIEIAHDHRVNTRADLSPSVSREGIAVKPLEFKTTWSHIWRCDEAGMMLVDESKYITGDKFVVYFCNWPIRDDDGKVTFFCSLERAKSAAQIYHQSRILSALTPGDTDAMTIAKYDDELRKAQQALKSVQRLISYPVAEEINPQGYDIRPVSKALVGAVYEVVNNCLTNTPAPTDQSDNPVTVAEADKNRLLDEKITLENSFGNGPYLDGLLRSRISQIDTALRALSEGE